ncbi:MAG: hypothetical protein J7M08_03380 [Planctomycetes bacterium]|nr:hypothetical protein [Planctomycetota bacterium]
MRNSISILVVFVALCAAAAPVGSALADAGKGKTTRNAGEKVTVMAVGFAPYDPGREVAEMHREALRDARKNALLQAYVLVRASARVENMTFKETRVRAHTAGYLEQMHVLEEGVVRGAGPPVYRVSVEATVLPLAKGRGIVADLALNRAIPWAPVVALHLQGHMPDDYAKEAKTALSDALARMGVAVSDGDRPSPALDVWIHVTLHQEDGDSFTQVSWEMGVGAVSGPPGRRNAPLWFRGQWRYSGQGSPPWDWWQGLAVGVAQDVMQLWALPRWTDISFQAPDKALRERLAQLFKTAAGAGVEYREKESVLLVGMPLTGDPLSAVQAALRSQALNERVELVDASLSRLQYRCLPGKLPPKRESTDKKPPAPQPSNPPSE